MRTPWCRQQRAVEAAGPARGGIGSDARSALSLGCGTNTSCARKLVIASAAVFMPVVTGVKFGYVILAGA